MDSRKELRTLLTVAVVFGIAFFLPTRVAVFRQAIDAALDLIRWYAREHVILCLLPAFFIAGIISVFISQNTILKYFGANAKKWLAYSIASVSGSILAVCSCTILPLFSSIYKRGAGLGPAIAFLYSGPGINILAIILTARILGWEMGIARTVGAIFFSIAIGLLMSIIYREEEQEKREKQFDIPARPGQSPLRHTLLLLFAMMLILIFANWGKPDNANNSVVWDAIWRFKWHITALFGLILATILVVALKIKPAKVLIVVGLTAASGLIANTFIATEKFIPLIPVLTGFAGLSIITLGDRQNNDNREWTLASWDFAKQMLPPLAAGIIIAGFLLGSTHDGYRIPGVIPDEWVASLVGGNSFVSNLFASVLGAFMYFATLTEIPILQGLISAGMGKGPALALLLAGPSLSLPNMLVIRSVMGNRKTFIYVVLVIVMATISGILFGLTG